MLYGRHYASCFQIITTEAIHVHALGQTAPFAEEDTEASNNDLAFLESRESKIGSKASLAALQPGVPWCPGSPFPLVAELEHVCFMAFTQNYREMWFLGKSGNELATPRPLWTQSYNWVHTNKVTRYNLNSGHSVFLSRSVISAWVCLSSFLNC